LQEKLVADKAFKGLTLVNGGKVQLEFGRRAVHHVASPATPVEFAQVIGTKYVIV